MTRIYQWDTPPELITEQRTLQFIDDDKNGGMIVECGFCSFEFNEKGLEVCPKCKNDLIFPRCDW